MDINYYSKYEPIFNAWYIKEELGEGSFGKVFALERQDYGTYRSALKAITIPQNQSEIDSVMSDYMNEASVKTHFKNIVDEFVDEFVLMSKLKGNSNIVSYEDHIVLPHENGIGWDILIRMELLTPLSKHIQKVELSTDDIITLGIDMCRALELCGKYSIIHRDIKPENIFIAETGDYKLGDFGIARTIEKTSSGLSKKGTYSYMAPEIYKGEQYGASVDIYSLGIVMYRFLNGNRLPFLPDFPSVITHNDRENAIMKRIKGDYLPAPANADKNLSKIILKACAYKPEDRYTSASEMREALEAVRCEETDGTVSLFAGGLWRQQGHKNQNVQAQVQGTFCTNCGANVTENEAFCTNCGTSVTVEDNKPVEAKKTEGKGDKRNPSKSLVISIVLASIALLLTAIYLLLSLGGNPPGQESSPPQPEAFMQTEEMQQTPEPASIPEPDVIPQNQVPDVTGMDLSHDGEIITEISLIAGEKQAYSVILKPSGAEANIYPVSSDPWVFDVFLVGSDGIWIEGIADGDAVLTVTAANVERKYRVSVYSSWNDEPPPPTESGYILDFSSNRLITDNDLFGLNRTELRIARNEIFARHGRMFDDDALQDWFNSKHWYTPIYSPDEFKNSFLSRIETDNVNKIIEYVNQMP